MHTILVLNLSFKFFQIEEPLYLSKLSLLLCQDVVVYGNVCVDGWVPGGIVRVFWLVSYTDVYSWSGYSFIILCEKYLQHQQNLCHVFIDFKKVFDRVWHAASWATMKKYNISTNLIRVIKNFCDKATSAVPFNSSIGDLFRTTVGV